MNEEENETLVPDYLKKYMRAVYGLRGEEESEEYLKELNRNTDYVYEHRSKKFCEDFIRTLRFLKNNNVFSVSQKKELFRIFKDWEGLFKLS